MEIYNDTYCVYVHINKINGKMYVGMTKNGDNPNKRWMSGDGYKNCRYFYSAILKYGWDNFSHEIVANNLTLLEANHFEELLIKMLNTTSSNNGYNLKSGGETNVFPQEVKAKMSKSHKGKILSGSTREKISQNSKSGTVEVREKISSALKGRKLSDKTKQKIGDASRGRNVGRHHTDEELEKMRKKRKKRSETTESVLKGVPISDEHKMKIQASSHKKTVLQKSLDGIIVREYNSLSNASRATGINLGNISSCCNGRVTTAGGFIWEFN